MYTLVKDIITNGVMEKNLTGPREIQGPSLLSWLCHQLDVWLEKIHSISLGQFPHLIWVVPLNFHLLDS